MVADVVRSSMQGKESVGVIHDGDVAGNTCTCYSLSMCPSVHCARNSCIAIPPVLRDFQLWYSAVNRQSDSLCRARNVRSSVVKLIGNNRVGRLRASSL